MVNSAGVRISSSGVYPGNPQYFNLAYQTGGNSSGWLDASNNDYGLIFGYEGTGTPGPAWCQRDYSGAGLSKDIEQETAQIGERDCYSDRNGIVGYLQVISVGPDGPTVKAWFWKGPPPPL